MPAALPCLACNHPSPSIQIRHHPHLQQAVWIERHASLARRGLNRSRIDRTDHRHHGVNGVNGSHSRRVHISSERGRPMAAAVAPAAMAPPSPSPPEPPEDVVVDAQRHTICMVCDFFYPRMGVRNVGVHHACMHAYINIGPPAPGKAGSLDLNHTHPIWAGRGDAHLVAGAVPAAARAQGHRRDARLRRPQVRLDTAFKTCLRQRRLIPQTHHSIHIHFMAGASATCTTA